MPDIGFNGRNFYPVNGAITNIAAGAWHSLALLQDGTVAAWGDSGGGQIYVPSGLGPVVAVAGGETTASR